MIDTSLTTDSTTERPDPQMAECVAGEVRFVGYARVSTDDQNLSLQIDALTKHGIPKSNIFMDKLSEANARIATASTPDRTRSRPT